MSRSLSFSIALASVLLVTASAGAEAFKPQIRETKTFADFTQGLQEMRDNIETVQCGGWVDDSEAQVMGASVKGKLPIPIISPDIPGRSNKGATAKAVTGLGDRGEFEYPDSAWGYSSACDIVEYNGKPMHDDDLAKLGIDLKINEDGSVKMVGGSGEIDINPFAWCIRMDKATPKYCKRLFDAYKQLSAIAPRPDPEALCPCADALNECPPRPPKRYCFDAFEDGDEGGPYSFVCHGTSDKKDKVTTTFPDAPPQDRTCRTTWEPEFKNKMTECSATDVFDDAGNYLGKNVSVNVPGEHLAVASSYYRHYAQDYHVPGITVKAFSDGTAEKIIKEWKVRAECYEYYKEEDPKQTITSMEDEQCEFIIATPDEQSPDKPQWPPGEGYRQKQDYKPDPVKVQEPPRQNRDTPEPWKADTKTNLNMIDMEKLKEKQKDFEDPSDISQVLGALLPTRQTASKTVSANARTDMFDDTAERGFSKFWEEQQRELLKMTADPQTRLIMPARFLVGLASTDPLYDLVRGVVSRSDGTVEIALKGGLEDLGSVLTSFQRTYIAPLREVRIPILVPLISVEEIDARIFDWKQWQLAEKKDAANPASPRASLDGEAEPLIQKLESYKTIIGKERELRGALAKLLVKLFGPEKEIREYFAQWYKMNTDLLVQAAQRSVQRRELQRIWKLTQQSMLQADECQMLWCANNRYSVPVYSLLDNWWQEEGSEGSGRDPGYKPKSLKEVGYVQPPDLLFDFSDVRFPRDPLRVPVLEPIIVKVKLPSPPLIGQHPEAAELFPDLPTLPGADIFSSFTPPTTDLPPPKRITLPPTVDLDKAKDMLREIRKKIDGKSIDEQKIEEDELKDNPKAAEENFAMDRKSMRGAYCRFPPSIVIPPDQQEESGNPAKIIHVENDLKERLARLFSRWMPERKEDNAGRVARLRTEGPKSDCFEDVLCYILPPEKNVFATWQWFMPKGPGADFTGIADDIKSQTLPEEDQNPYQATMETLKKIFPNITLPIPVDPLPPF